MLVVMLVSMLAVMLVFILAVMARFREDALYAPLVGADEVKSLIGSQINYLLVIWT